MSSNGTTGMPGMNAMGDTLEFVKNLWGSMKIPGMSVPSLSPEEIDKQIADLKAVESWLQINMGMLRSSIQALEVQSATLSALRSMGDTFAKAASPAPAADKPAFESPFAKDEKAGGDANVGGMPETAALAAQLANPAMWWNAVQDQFSNAVNQVMTPVATPKKRAAKKAPAKKAAASKASASKTTARKRASKS